MAGKKKAAELLEERAGAILARMEGREEVAREHLDAAAANLFPTLSEPKRRQIVDRAWEQHQGPPATTSGGCRENNARGKPCGTTPGPNGLCVWHDPDRAEEAASLRQKGGKNRKRGKPRDPNARPPDLSTPAGTIQYLQEAAAEAECLDLSPAKVKSMIQVATAAFQVHDTLRKEARLRRLERMLNLDEITPEEMAALSGLHEPVPGMAEEGG